jgi:mannan endo-1,4-beta-mannosidase
MRHASPILILLIAALGCSSQGSSSPSVGSTAAPISTSTATAGATSSTVTAPTTSAATPSAPVTSPPATPPANPFVQVDRANAQFVLAGKPFYFAGTNAYYLMSDTAYGSTSVVTDALDAAQTAGFRVVRTWGFNDGPGTDPSKLQTQPGVYQDSAFKAMDFVISEAGKRGLHLIITLVNNWDDYGGMDQYVAWAGLTGHDVFYTDAGIKQTFKNYMRDFTSRVNSITGIAYKDDPTIMSWELANEAECKADPGALQGILAGWYAEMSAYLKSVDPNHLISTGEEGFDTTTSGYTSLTSYTTYFALFSWFDGTGFTQNVALPDIDWGGIHLYPNTWQWLDPVADGTNWIADHVALARSHGKPLVLGEYGLQSSPHSIYKTWMDAVISSNAAGALLWEFIPASRAAQTTEPFNVIYPTDAADVANLEQAAAVLNAK